MTRRTMSVLAALLIAAAGCSSDEDSPDAGGSRIQLNAQEVARADAVVKTAALRAFDGCGDVAAQMRDQTLPYVGPYGLEGAAARRGVTIADAEVGTALAGTASEDVSAANTSDAGGAVAAPKAGVDYSDTNVQEAGVDEPDTVETDGRRIFTVAAQTLHAAVVEDGAPRLVGRLPLENYGSQLLLAGDRLMIIGGGGPVTIQDTPVGAPAADMAIAPAGPERTLVQIVDVSNPRAMKVTSTVRLDGGYVNARAIDGVARIVLRRNEPNITFRQPKDGTESEMNSAAAANKEAVRRATFEQWIPRFELEDEGGEETSGVLSSCEDTYRPISFSGTGTITVVTIDAADPRPRNGSTVVGGGDIVYASKDAVYVTSINYGKPIPLGRPGIAAPEIAPVPSDTQIHKFDIRSDTATYVASGSVKGSLLNQFSLSEDEGLLRVATTDDPTSFGPVPEGGKPSESFVRVLAQSGKGLVEVGRVGGLGRGERIYAVRFLGKVGYVVTFKQIDPLYTVDLSDPRKPKVAGELKIPGFSSYLHPIGGGRVIGVGQHVGSDLRQAGTKVSLFDVSDPAKPRELRNRALAGASSEAEFDHHAFLWWGPERLAVLPISIWSVRGDSAFMGAVALRVEDRGIDEASRISHPQANPSALPPGGAEDAGGVVAGPFSPPITRTLVVGDLLISLSEGGILASDLSTLGRKAWLPFPRAEVR